MRWLFETLSALMLLASVPIGAQELSPPNQLLVSEGLRFLSAAASRWDGLAKAPTAILLVTEDHEFLIGHPSPTEDFRRTDDLHPGGPRVYVRDRTFEPGLLATFPAVGSVPTIVIGTPAATSLGPTRWVLILFHEHFHQLQMSQPGYADAVERLDLSGGENNGMWMLNYPFPYSSEDVAGRVNALGGMAGRLARAAEDRVVDEESLDRYLEARRTVAAELAPRDFRYLEFQLWQEGLARFAELDAARAEAGRFEFAEEFRALPGYESLSEASTAIHARAMSALSGGIGQVGRPYFYSLGAIEGMILDAFRPGWRGRYLAEMLSVGAYFR
jgi:hypothetical protein